jgi:hypothetical protein
MLVAAAPAAAAHYSATLHSSAPPRLIAPDISWNCSDLRCEGATEESRPAVLCEALAKRAGAIDNFLVEGRPFTPAELERCNAAAHASHRQSAAAR